MAVGDVTPVAGVPTTVATGEPKPAMLTHRCLWANLEGLRALSDPPAVTPDDRVLAVLPLFGAFGLNAVLTSSLAVGATLVLADRFVPAETLDLIRSERVTARFIV